MAQTATLPNLVIADSSAILYKGMRETLRKNFHVLKQVTQPHLLLQKQEQYNFKVALINADIKNTDILELTSNIYKVNPSVRVAVYTQNFCKTYVRYVSLGGCHGYITSNTASKQITSGMSSILNNSSFIPPEIYTRFMHQSNDPILAYDMPKFKVFYYAVRGYSTKEISEKINTSTSNIYKHQEQIHLDTKTSNIRDLIYYAIINEYLPSSELTDHVRYSKKINTFRK